MTSSLMTRFASQELRSQLDRTPNFPKPIAPATSKSPAWPTPSPHSAAQSQKGMLPQQPQPKRQIQHICARLQVPFSLQGGFCSTKSPPSAMPERKPAAVEAELTAGTAAGATWTEPLHCEDSPNLWNRQNVAHAIKADEATESENCQWRRSAGESGP